MSKINLFAQVVQLLPRDSFKKLVAQYQTDKHCKGFDSWAHLISMMFCHLAQANSNREVECGIKSSTGNINHLGCKRAPSKSTLAYQNAQRDWHLFEAFYFNLLDHIGKIAGFKKPALKRLKREILILDSTTIPLCLKMFDWAHFRKHKGAVKLHTLLDYRGCLPSMACITPGKTHDSKIAKSLRFPKGSVGVFDKAYINFEWLKDLDSNGIFFVTRAKDNMNYTVLSEYEIEQKAKDNVLEDLDVALAGYYSSNKYAGKLRLVRYYDHQTARELVFMTNNLSWTATTVADIYKERWNIEVFFKHIKQHLKIKSFIGTSENAVQIQIWTALIVILLLKALQQMARYKWHLSNLVMFIRVNLFVKITLMEWINNPIDPEKEINQDWQLNLFSG